MLMSPPHHEVSDCGACEATHNVVARPLLILALLLFCYTAGVAKGASIGLDSERSALVALFQTTNGPSTWKDTGTQPWLVSNSSSNYCLWLGVKCTAGDHQVSEIVLSSMGLSGTLPAYALGTLTSLVKIDLQDNRIGGVLPLDFGNFTALVELHLENNFFSGSLPGALSRCVALKLLHVYNTSVSGTIPSSWSTMTNMRAFDVSLNQLTGTLPPEFDQWKRLTSFAVYLNSLTGVLPPSYGPAWFNVTKVLIYRTHIGGPIPDSWGAMKNMYELQLFNNQLNGTLPASLGNYSSLYYINLSFNNFSGPVPWAAWLAWRNVKVIGFQDNPYLSGVVPDTWGSVLIQLSSMFAVCRTEICGPQLPALIFGYGCATSSYIKQLTVIDDASMTTMITTSAYQPSVPCPTPQPAAPRNRTQTIPTVLPPQNKKTSQSSSVAISRNIMTASASVNIS